MPNVLDHADGRAKVDVVEDVVVVRVVVVGAVPRRDRVRQLRQAGIERRVEQRRLTRAVVDRRARVHVDDAVERDAWRADAHEKRLIRLGRRVAAAARHVRVTSERSRADAHGCERRRMRRRARRAGRRDARAPQPDVRGLDRRDAVDLGDDAAHGDLVADRERGERGVARARVAEHRRRVDIDAVPCARRVLRPRSRAHTHIHFSRRLPAVVVVPFTGKAWENSTRRACMKKPPPSSSIALTLPSASTSTPRSGDAKQSKVAGDADAAADDDDESVVVAP